MTILSSGLWPCGCSAIQGALADPEHALNDAREIGHAATLMFALFFASFTYILRKLCDSECTRR